MEHIVRYEDMYFVTIPREFTKTDKDNAFGITGEFLYIKSLFSTVVIAVIFGFTFDLYLIIVRRSRKKFCSVIFILFFP